MDPLTEMYLAIAVATILGGAKVVDEGIKMMRRLQMQNIEEEPEEE